MYTLQIVIECVMTTNEKIFSILLISKEVIQETSSFKAKILLANDFL